MGDCDRKLRRPLENCFVRSAAQLRSGATACLIGQDGTGTKMVLQPLASLLANPIGMMPALPHAEKSASSSYRSDRQTRVENVNVRPQSTTWPRCDCPK